MAHLASSGPIGWPQLVFLLFAGAVWLINAISRAKAARPGAAPARAAPEQPEPTEAPAAQDTGADERAQRVREEILRKIAERRASASTRDLRTIIKAEYERREPAGGSAPADFSGALPAAAAAMAIPPMAPPPGIGAAGPVAPTPGAVWLDELRSRDCVRRAILAREILGPPIALR
jgi:hypothetical protein